MMCNMMCNPTFQCPFGLMFDDVIGECVSGSDCTTEFVLPPGMAIGRPFFTVEESPTKASPVNAMSDWVVEL